MVVEGFEVGRVCRQRFRSRGILAVSGYTAAFKDDGSAVLICDVLA